MSIPHPTHSQILDAARRLFGEDGYDATSVAGIARQVGVVEGAVYRHFPSKRDLLHQVIASFYEPLIASATDAIADVASPTERIRLLIRRQLQAFTDDRLLCRLLISEARSFDDYYESVAAELSRRYTALFLAAFAAGVESGELRADIPATVARDIVYGSIEHLAWSSLSGHGDLDVEATTDQLMSVISCGLVEVVAATDQSALNELTEATDRLNAIADRLAADSPTIPASTNRPDETP